MDNEPLLKLVRHNIESYGLLDKGDGVVAGVSGGADSVCLLNILKELRSEYRLNIAAVHVNHGLRGAEALEDQEYVRSICNDWDIPLKLFSIDVNSISQANRTGLEETGRDARYGIFRQVMKESGFNRIAVAHNLEDQAETVMLHILRGTGLDGLCGMRIKQGCIIRPLLNISRGQILKYLDENKIPYRTDSSNLENEYTRNKVRNVLFPLVRREFGVNPANQLSRLSLVAQEDKDYLDNISEKAFNNVLLKDSGVVELDLKLLSDFPAAVIKRIIRRAWERISCSHKNLDQVHVEQILNLCKNNHTGKKAVLPKGIVARVSYGVLVFSKTAEEAPEVYEYRVKLEGSTMAPNAEGRLEGRVMPAHEAFGLYGNPDSIKENSLIQLFDYDSLGGGIVLRNRRDGDRIRPSGACGEKKLKEYFIDKKIPQEKRSRIPLLAKGSSVVWIVGMRTSQDFRAGRGSKLVWVLSWRDL